MLLAFAAAVCLALPSNLQVEDPAALVPENTLVFFGTHSVRLASLSSKNSAISRILAEPEVKAFLQKPVAAAQAVIDDALKDSGMEEAEGRSLSLTDMMGGSAEGPPLGKMFLALTHISMPAGGEGAPGMPPELGLVIGVELLEANDIGLVKALWARIPAPEETGNHNGHDFFRKQLGEGKSVALAFLGNMAVISMSETTLFGVMSRFDAKGKTDGSLAGNADYRKLISTNGGMATGASTSFVRIGALVEIAKAGLQLAAIDPEIGEFAPKILDAIDRLGVHSLRWSGSVSSRDAKGRVLSTAVTAIDPGATGLVPRMLASEKPLDLSRLERVPGNSLSLSAGSIDGLGEVYDFLMGTFESVAPDEYVVANDFIKQVMGESDLRKDLFDNLQGNFVSFSVPGEGFPGTPASVMRVGLRDSDAFAKALQSLVTNVSAMFLSDTPVTLTETEHEGHRFFELDISRTPAAVVMMTPAFAFDEGEFVASLESAKVLKSELNGSAGTGSINENKELMDFIAELGKSGVVRSVSFSNNASTFSAAYGQLAGAAGMFGGSLDLPLDFSLLPTDGAISKHLGTSYSAGYADKDGSTFVNRGVSQFAMGDFLPLLMTAAALGVAQAGGGPEPVVRELTPEEQVQDDLAQLSAGMTVYNLSEGNFPASIDDLVRPLANYPDGCLGRTEAPVDPWGNPYRFKLNEKKKPVIWSTGPDGIDQEGAGDDISKSRR